MELCGIGGKKRIARIGSMFGEMAILGLSPNGRRLRSARTVSVCELVELPKEALTEVHEDETCTSQNYKNLLPCFGSKIFIHARKLHDKITLSDGYIRNIVFIYE